MADTRRRRRGRVRLGVLGVIAGVGAVTAVAAAEVPRTSAGTGAVRTALPAASERVIRQTLVDTQREAGTLGHGVVTTVAARITGTITKLPAPQSILKRGDSWYRVDNTPVVLLYGALPAYRALSPGTKGADVRQLEQNLYALGYRGFTVDRTDARATARAVKTWQGRLGLAKTGTVELGRVVYATGPVRVDAVKVAVGDVAAPGTPLITSTGNTRVATVELDVSDVRLAALGAAVSVTLPDGRSVPGKVAGTATIIKPAEGQTPATTKIQVTVSMADQAALAGFDDATAAVVFTAARRENVLSVPVAALLALAEGGYGVQVIEGSTTRIIAVRTGMFAAGRVEVSGDGLAEGMTVGMPS